MRSLTSAAPQLGEHEVGEATDEHGADGAAGDDDETGDDEHGLEVNDEHGIEVLDDDGAEVAAT